MEGTGPSQRRATSPEILSKAGIAWIRLGQPIGGSGREVLPFSFGDGHPSFKLLREMVNLCGYIALTLNTSNLRGRK